MVARGSGDGPAGARDGPAGAGRSSAGADAGRAWARSIQRSLALASTAGG